MSSALTDLDFSGTTIINVSAGVFVLVLAFVGMCCHHTRFHPFRRPPREYLLSSCVARWLQGSTPTTT